MTTISLSFHPAIARIVAVYKYSHINALNINLRRILDNVISLFGPAVNNVRSRIIWLTITKHSRMTTMRPFFWSRYCKDCCGIQIQSYQRTKHQSTKDFGQCNKLIRSRGKYVTITKNSRMTTMRPFFWSRYCKNCCGIQIQSYKRTKHQSTKDFGQCNKLIRSRGK